jgi:polyisoprenoid-binding protein YceI
MILLKHTFAYYNKNHLNMKSTSLKITLLAFLAMGVFSCKNNEPKAEQVLDEAAEASETATSYKLDTDASVIKWEGSKPTATHHGTVKLSSGTLLGHQGNIEAGNFTIDMTTIADEDLEGDDRAQLEAHLKGTAEGQEGDFFNVKQYPTAKFEMTGIENNMVKGNLTIKDQTHPVQFPAKVSVTEDKLTVESEMFELDRTKWGINFGSKSVFPNLGDKFISDTMKIAIFLVANKA